MYLRETTFEHVPFTALSPPATAEDVQIAETQLTTVFPSDYRKFLLTVNWALTHDGHDTLFTGLPEPYREVSIGSICGLPTRKLPTSTVVEVTELYRRRKPSDGPIPFDAIYLESSTDEWDLFLMTSRHRYGEVWIKAWFLLDADPDYNNVIGNPESYLFKVSESFADMVRSLK